MKQNKIGQEKGKGPKVLDEVKNILKKYVSIGIWARRVGEVCIFVIGIIFFTLDAMGYMMWFLVYSSMLPRIGVMRWVTFFK